MSTEAMGVAFGLLVNVSLLFTMWRHYSTTIAGAKACAVAAKGELAAYKLHVSETYSRKDETNQRLQRIEDKIDQLNDTLHGLNASTR